MTKIFVSNVSGFIRRYDNMASLQQCNVRNALNKKFSFNWLRDFFGWLGYEVKKLWNPIKILFAFLPNIIQSEGLNVELVIGLFPTRQLIPAKRICLSGTNPGNK